MNAVEQQGPRMSVVDVAERAGVSIATVSRVLNNSRHVNPAIAEDVRKAIAELQYSPQRVRRRNNTQPLDTEEGTIAIVSIGQEARGWFAVPVIAAAIAAVSRCAEQHRLALAITEMPQPEIVNPILRRKNVLGALAFIAGALDTRAAQVLSRTLPAVRIMGGQLAPTEIDHVTVDNNAVGYVGAKHLLSLGCKKLAFLTMAPSWHFIRLRGNGFAAAAQEAGVPMQMYEAGGGPNQGEDFRPMAGLVDRLIAGRPDGLFVPRDEEAVEVYRLLSERNVQVGRDLKIVSCDNDSVRLSTLHPRPPSIELGLDEIAHHAVRRLIWRIKHPKAPPVRILVNPQLVLPTDEALANGAGESREIGEEAGEELEARPARGRARRAGKAVVAGDGDTSTS